MKTDYFTIFVSIILIIILSYSLFDYIFVPKIEPLMGSINNAINQVGQFPGQIANLANQVRNEVSKVGDLGEEVGRLGRQINAFPGQVRNELGSVFKQSEDYVGSKFDTVKREVTDIAGEVQGMAQDFYGQASAMSSEIGEVVEDIPGEVEAMSRMIFLDKIPQAFTSAWNWFYNNVIAPIIKFFYSLGNIFSDIGNVLLEIFYFLIRLPLCIPLYLFDAVMKILKGVYNRTFPQWLKSIISFINKYIIELILVPIFGVIIYVFRFLLELLGFNFSLGKDITSVLSKCYDTGIIGEIIDAVLSVIMSVFSGLGDIFRMFNFDALIGEIMSIF
jgi:hypothetical protein